MNNFISILKEFEGLIGAILGTIATLIVTHLLKNTGKIRKEIKNVKLSFFKLDRWGKEIEEDLQTAEYGRLTFDLELFNTAEIPKALRELKVKINDKSGNTLLSIIPQDDGTKRSTSYTVIREELPIVNIQPKQLVKYELFVPIDQDMIKKIYNWDHINFYSETPKGKKFEDLIIKRE